MTIIRHEVKDDWKVEIDGKVYWASRYSVDGREIDWTVEVVRLSPNGQNPYARDVNHNGPVHRKVVAYVKEQIKERTDSPSK